MKQFNIIHKFINSSIFNKILNLEKTEEVLFIFLGGSYQTNVNLANDDSDYDIFVIVKNINNTKIKRINNTFTFKYNMKNISIRLLTIQDFFSIRSYNSPLNPITLYKEVLLCDNDIYYKNPKYENFINYIINDSFFKEQLKKISYYAISAYIKNLDNINLAFQTNNFHNIKFLKFFNLIYFSLTKMDNTFDINIYQKLVWNKNHYQEYQYLSNEENKKLCLLLKNYYDNILKNPYDCIDAMNALRQTVFSKFNIEKKEISNDCIS